MKNEYSQVPQKWVYDILVDILVGSNYGLSMKLWVQVCSYLHSNGDLCTTNQSIANWAEMEHKYESGAVAMRWWDESIVQYESYNRLVPRALRASNQSSIS